MTDTERQDELCAVIPAYAEERSISGVVSDVLGYVGTAIVVDDGSPDETATRARAAGAQVLAHDTNQGKGAAVLTGLTHAAESGFLLAIVIDADGQHLAADIPGLIDVHKRTNAPIVVGNRMSEPADMPLVRRLTNHFMSWLLSRQMGQHVPDTQCGFRLYRTDAMAYDSIESGRFAAESEILLLAADMGLVIESAPVTTVYSEEKSKINPVSDTLRFFSMLRNYKRTHRNRA